MKKNVLLVEYDTPTIETLNELLSSPVFNVTIADEGEKAKDLVKDNNYDLVITAAMLPKFHGFNLSQFIGNHSPNTKIIIISGIYKGIEYKHQAMTQYKADDFFEKPLNKPEFKKRVLEFLSITEEDLSDSDDAPVTQIPVHDTAKIPLPSEEEKEEDKYSSDQLFGDIIEKVEQIPSYEIKIDDKDKPKAKAPAEEKPVAPAKKETAKFDNQRIDHELDKIIQAPAKAKTDTKKFRKIEEDISKKFEDTLSGLGIKSKSSPKKGEKKPEPDAAEQKDAEKKPKEVETGGEATQRIPASNKDELGDYDILGLIARGGMAEIYKAKKKGVKGFEKIIAIKKILSGYGEDDKYIEMFVDEAKIAAELTHPNIVQIYDLGKKDDYYFIAMEYIQGKDLRLVTRRLIEQEKWIPEEIAIHLLTKVLEALSHAHSAKNNKGQNLDIVHRDISPPNIMISYSGDVKLTDFGVSKASTKMHQTISGSLKGKLLYMSPEQAKGDRDIDYRSDLYAVGVLLFELVTGKKLFHDSSEVAVLLKVQRVKISNPREYQKDNDPEHERIIMKALKKDRKARYQSANEMIQDLEAYLDKAFDHRPASIHVSHFLCPLFKQEIKKEGVKVDLKSLPFEIKRRVEIKEEAPEEEQIVELKDEISEEAEEIIELPEETIEEEFPEDEESKPFPGAEPVEIDVDAPEPIKVEVEAPEPIKVEVEPLETVQVDVSPDKKEPPSGGESQPGDKPKSGEESSAREKSESKPSGKQKKQEKASPAAAAEKKDAMEEPREEEFQPTIEIDFDKPKPIEEPDPVPEAFSPKTPRRKKSLKVDRSEPLSLPHEIHKPLKKVRGKRSVLVLSIVLFVVAGIAAGYYFLTRTPMVEEPPPVKKNPVYISTRTNIPGEWMIQTETKEEPEVKQIPLTEQADGEDSQQPLPKEATAQDQPEQKAAEKQPSPDTQPKVKEPQPKTTPPAKAAQKETEVKKTQPQSATSQQLKKEEKKPEETPQTTTDEPAEKTSEESQEETPATTKTEPAPQPAPPPEIKEGQILAAAELDVTPVPVSTPSPRISRKARRSMASTQNLLVNILIDHNGNVEKVKLLKRSPSMEINSMVISTLAKWTYKPASKNGIRVKTWKSIPITIQK